MVGRGCSRRAAGRAGFTLIEVIGAFLIFALGVLMVIQLGTSLNQRMIYSAKKSEIVVLAQELLDSLEATPFDSLSTGTVADTVAVEGTPYARSATVSLVTAVLYQVDVTMTPVTGDGPTHARTSYVSAPW